jgi:hypothetical protein
MGGVYNYVNLHAYHYAGNNPVVLRDPDGEWTISFSINGYAGAGTQVSTGLGLIMGFSFAEGYSSGHFTTYSFGAQQGAGISATVAIDFVTKEVVTGTSRSLTMGGSGNLPIGVGVGGDVSIDLETGISSVSGSVSIGPSRMISLNDRI